MASIRVFADKTGTVKSVRADIRFDDRGTKRFVFTGEAGLSVRANHGGGSHSRNARPSELRAFRSALSFRHGEFVHTIQTEEFKPPRNRSVDLHSIAAKDAKLQAAMTMFDVKYPQLK